ncbi:hypothetical protein C3V36_09100 [Lachnospiraceae bacterium oral taxon 500]|nr:hypothetical protein C3V36_09100 [Lachnospiraceae bacterium oral taxon 500]
MVNQVMQAGYEYAKEILPKNETVKKEEVKEETQEKPAATLEVSEQEAAKKAGYVKPDLVKIRQMQAESQQKMLQKMLGTAKDTFIKQAGGLKNILGRALAGEKVEGFDFDFTAADIEQAKKDVADGGYWSAESTSDRLVEFAKAISGGDVKQKDALVASIKEGFKQAEELWGGKLPQISQDTYRLTMEKLDNWAKGE